MTDQRWKAGRFTLSYSAGKPLVMGIVNVTPDSFSDGGAYFSARSAIEHASRLFKDGADIVDIGGESTRPGSAGVEDAEEWRRIREVVKEVVSWNRPVSVDTMKVSVMRMALDEGVDILNDVNAFRSDGAEALLAESAVGAIVMHMQGQPRTMQDSPTYGNVVTEVSDFLTARLRRLNGLGIPCERLLVDPGFGFGKTLAHNIELFNSIPGFSVMGAGVLIGVSRKRMIADICSRADPSLRISGSVAAALRAAQLGAAVLRVHDVQETVDALRVWNTLS